MSVRTALKANFTTEPRLDTHPETRLDFDQVRLAAQERYDRPFLLVDPHIVRTKARRFKAAMPRVHPHYAVKANPHPAVLRTLMEEGVGFEIASPAELDLLVSLGREGRRHLLQQPGEKPQLHPDRSRARRAAGTFWTAWRNCARSSRSSPTPACTCASTYPTRAATGRCRASSARSRRKPRRSSRSPAELKADLAGLTFHVGSQCRNVDNWRVGIETAKRMMRKMRLQGLKPRLLNIGGGFPVRHTKPIPSIEVIGEVVNRALAGLPDGVRVMAEPGRYLVSDAGWFVCRVAGTATRSRQALGLPRRRDVRRHHRDDRRAAVRRAHRPPGRLIPWTVAGPTCDSVDVVMRDQLLPEDLAADDLVYIPNAAAYTTAYASNFNGFPLPEVRV